MLDERAAPTPLRGGDRGARGGGGGGGGRGGGGYAGMGAGIGLKPLHSLTGRGAGVGLSTSLHGGLSDGTDLLLGGHPAGLGSSGGTLRGDAAGSTGVGWG